MKVGRNFNAGDIQFITEMTDQSAGQGSFTGIPSITGYQQQIGYSQHDL